MTDIPTLLSTPALQLFRTAFHGNILISVSQQNVMRSLTVQKNFCLAIQTALCLQNGLRRQQTKELSSWGI